MQSPERVADFDFDLPRDAIADRPARPRDSARLLHVGEGLADHHVRDLPQMLRPGDLLVLNDTRVIPARLRGIRSPTGPEDQRGDASVEVTLHLNEAPDRWRAFAKPAKRLRVGDRLQFSDDFAAEIGSKGDGGEVSLWFDVGGANLLQRLGRHGEMPLPPYIPRPHGADAQDSGDYQTVYARHDGAVAAPTAGLHLTEALFEGLRVAGIGTTTVTLHVGAGTFLPVTAEKIADHVMHAEFGEIGAEAAAQIRETQAAGGRIIAVGTTSLRLLESAARDGEIDAFSGDTDLFITPGFRFRVTDVLLTNFHLPKSTLFMLVCAFAGVGRMKRAYAHAVAAGYRFYSYGDACLLEPAPEAPA